jgi:surface protein
MKHFSNQSNGSHVGRMNYGGAKFCRFALFPLMLLMLLLLPAGMVAQKAASSSKYIATYESSTQTLTFKENVGETLPENSAWVKDKQTVATINKNLGNGTIVHIVFDKSFSTYTPTSLLKFFRNLTHLETITGLEYLNTANVTDMRYMFSSCSSLTSLDVTYFNTANVTDMSFMFANCSSLTSLDVTHFNTEKVTGMSRMFIGCSALLSLDVTNFNTANVTDMSYMFSDCVALTSLYLTNFNTEKVTDMDSMFSSCRALTTIYASSKFVTTQVSNSSSMFYKCEKLKGEEVWTKDKATDKTYAKIEGGYFSGGIPRVKYADGTLTFFLTSKETLGENEYELNSGKNLPGWAKHTLGITKVVFDTSFANARPTSCYKWFFWCDKLNQVEGIKNLNTKEVTDMADMFCDCKALSSLDVSGFNTEKVTDMSGMFYECISLKLLDVVKFNTANVKSMGNMFYNGQNLASLNVTNFNTARWLWCCRRR